MPKPPSAQPAPLRCLSILLGCAMVAVVCTGCQSWYKERIVRDSFADLRELADKQEAKDELKRVDSKDKSHRKGYAILLDMFEGPHHQRRADRLAQRLMAEAHVPDLWVQTVDDKGISRVLRGIYPTPDVDDAVRDLRQTRMVMLNGSRPYQEVTMISLVDNGLLTNSPYDLRNYPGALTLQIGFYDPSMDGDFRAIAEKAVDGLRADGEQAYFYHGPNMSMVCVGMFNTSDRIQRVHQGGQAQVIAVEYSERVNTLRLKFPFNLGNGRRLMIKDSKGNESPMRSVLVEVPRIRM